MPVNCVKNLKNKICKIDIYKVTNKTLTYFYSKLCLKLVV